MVELADGGEEDPGAVGAGAEDLAGAGIGEEDGSVWIAGWPGGDLGRLLRVREDGKAAEGVGGCGGGVGKES